MDAPSARRHFNEADRLFRQGRHAEALQLLQRLNQAFPANKDVLYATALCLRKLGRHDEAARLCHDLIRIHDHSKAKALLASIERRMPSATPEADAFSAADVALDSLQPLSMHARALITAIGIAVHFLRLPLFAVLFGALFLMLSMSLALTENEYLAQSALINRLMPEELQDFSYSGGIVGLLSGLGWPLFRKVGWILLLIPFALGFIEFLAGRHIRETGFPMYVKLGIVAAYFVILWIYTVRAMPFDGEAAEGASALIALAAVPSFSVALAALVGLSLLSLVEEVLVEGFSQRSHADA